MTGIDNVEPQQNIGLKRDLLRRSLVPAVQSAIGRVPNLTEIRAMGFVIEKKRSGEVQASPFMENVFGVRQGMPPRDAAWAIHTVIHNTRVEELERLLAENSGNPEEQRKFKADKRLAENAHRNAEDGFRRGESLEKLGGIPDYMLPDWLKEAM